MIAQNFKCFGIESHVLFIEIWLIHFLFCHSVSLFLYNFPLTLLGSISDCFPPLILIPLHSFSLASSVWHKRHVHSRHSYKAWNIYPYHSCHRAELCVAFNAFCETDVKESPGDKISCACVGCKQTSSSSHYLQREIPHSAMKYLYWVWRVNKATKMSFISFD